MPKATPATPAPDATGLTNRIDSNPPTTGSSGVPMGGTPTKIASPGTFAAPAVTTSAQSPDVSAAFDGLHYGTNAGFSNAWVPPDVQVAAGPNHIVEMVNTLVAIYTKQGASLHTEELYTFFAVPSTDFISDPKIQYDAGSGRWFASITDITSSSVRLAVSSTSDPMDPWHTSSVGGTGCLDQPILGAGTASVIVSVNVFSSCTSRNYVYLGAEYWVLNKTDLATGRPAASVSFGPFSTQGSVHPVQVLGISSSHFLVTVDSVTGSSANAILLYNVTGVPPSTVAVIPTRIPIRPVSASPPADQSGSRHSLDTSDTRISDAVWSDGAIWFGLDTACTPSGDSKTRACVRLVELDTTTSKVLQDFDVAAAGMDFFYPALRTDGTGNLVTVFGFSSANEFPGIMVTGRLSGDAPNTVQTPVLVKAGTGPEDPSSCSSTCRYGDYFGSALDPSDPSLVWAAGEFGTSSGWGTHIFGARVKAALTFSYVVGGGGSGYTEPSLTYTLDGATRTATIGTTPTPFAADPGSPWRVSDSLTGPSLTETWKGTDPLPFKGTANRSLARTFTYTHMYLVVFGYDIVGGGAGATPPPVNYTQAGLTYHDFFPVGRYAWVDAGTTYAYDNPLAGSTSSERWFANGATTGTVDGPLNLTVLYYHQYGVTFRYEATGAGSAYPPPDVTYTAFGSPATVIATAAAWADAQSGYAFPVALGGSTDSERWGATSPASGIVTDPGEVLVSYRHQFYLTLGTAPADAGSVAPSSGWFDAGSTVDVSATAKTGWGFQSWTGSGPGSYAGPSGRMSLGIDGPITEIAAFYPGLTIAARGGGSVAYAYGTTTGTVPAGSTVTIYVPPGTIVSLVSTPGSPYDAFGGWTGEISSGAPGASVRVDTPTSVTANFEPSVGYVIMPAAVVLAAVGLLAFLAWRRYRKRRP